MQVINVLSALFDVCMERNGRIFLFFYENKSEFHLLN